MVSLDSIRRSVHANGIHRRPSRVVAIRVRGGYRPDTVRAEAGTPLRLVFHREETSSGSEQVVFPAFGKSAMLPTGEAVAVDLLPREPGEYEFTCALGLLRGRLVVEPARGGDPHPTHEGDTR